MPPRQQPRWKIGYEERERKVSGNIEKWHLEAVS
jgi:hypothetical protein